METNLADDTFDFAKNQKIITQLINQKDCEGIRMIDRVNTQWLIFQLDRIKLEFIEVHYPSGGLDIVDFTRMFLRVIPHEQEEILYLVMAILELFQEIISAYCVEKVTFKNITDHLCQRILFERTDSNTVKTRLLPKQKTIQPASGVREIEVQAPVIYGENQQIKARISLKKLKSDRYKHSGRIRKYISQIFSCFFSKANKQIYALNTMSDFIGVYDLDCTLINKITPTNNSFKKDTNIIHFAYSERQQRIGAVLKDYSIVFWDIGKKWQGEKSFSVTSYCSEYQCNIWFMEAHNMWLTSDSTGVLYSWDITSQKPLTKTILQNKNKITDLCELACLGLIALAQQHRIHDDDKKIQSVPSKIVIYNIRKNLRVSEFSVSCHGVHTLHFSNTYQILLAASFDTMIHLLQVNPVYFDVTLKGALVGHQSIISTFLPIEKSPVLISADDKGNIKLWDIRNYKCLQTVSMGQQVLINKFVDMSSINKLCFTGSRVSLIDFDVKQIDFRTANPQNSLIPIHIEQYRQKDQLLVFTKKDLRVYCLRTGTIKHIHSGLFDSQDDLLTAKYISSKNNLILISEQGKLKMCSIFNGNLSNDIIKSQSSVTCIAYDSQNSLFVSAGDDSNIIIQKKVGTNRLIEVRRFSDNFSGKEITTLQLSPFYSSLAIANSSQGTIFIWDYEMGKLIGGIEMESNLQPLCLSFVNGYNLLIIGCSKGQFFIVKFTNIDGVLQFQLLLKMQFLAQDKEDTLIKQILDLRVNSQKMVLCQLVAGTKSGVVYEFDLTKQFQNFEIAQRERKKYYHMPQTLLRQSFQSEISKKKFNLFKIDQRKCKKKLSSNHIIRTYAHKDSISSFSLIQQQERYRVTSGIDGRVMVWKRGGILVCDLNINLPLPYKWELTQNDEKKTQAKLRLALLVIRGILSRYLNKMQSPEEQLINIGNYLSKLDCALHEERQRPRLKIKVFQEEFSKKDLHYDRMKEANYTQITGPSLRQMKFDSRMKLLQKERKQQSQRMCTGTIETDSKQARNSQREQLLQFLIPSKQNTMENQSQYIRNVSILFNPKFTRQSYEQNLMKTEPQQKLAHSKRLQVSKQNKSELFESYYSKKKSGIWGTNPCPSLWQDRDKSSPIVSIRKHHQHFGSILRNLKKDVDISKKKSRKLDGKLKTWNNSEVEYHKVIITAPDLTNNRKLYRRTCRRIQMLDF